MRDIWQRFKSSLVRLLRRELPAGRFEAGAKFSLHGWLKTAPLVWPRREYLLYLPRGWSKRERVPLLVLCHACKQTPEEIAAATRMTELADRERWLILLPRQKDSANSWRCWNWFDERTAQGKGEAAIVSAQIAEIVDDYRIDSDRVFVAGMSAGGALAAVMGIRHPDIVHATIVHSGLACGAAGTAVTALGVMKRGPDNDIDKIAVDARNAAGNARRAPLLVIHGDDDAIVAPRNAIALVRQFLRFNAHPAVEALIVSEFALPMSDAESRQSEEGRTITTRDWHVDGHLIVRLVTVSGLGHAWSGGDGKYPFNDTHPPDATALIEAFVRDALRQADNERGVSFRERMRWLRRR